MKVTAAGAGYTCAAAPNLAVPEKKSINPELWQACAGPLVNLPAAGTLVVYFPQGHSEQVAASMKNNADAQTPNYPNLPSNLLCLLHSVTLHADPETDGVYAQMTLQPVSSFDNEALLRSDLSLKSNKPQPDFFCKTLTASDTSTHGGFSVPRRAAEKIFPPLDFSMQPPAQELVARDLHENVWNFRHIYRGQPKRHLLTTGWSLFVSGKRLFAGDSVLFIRDERQQLLLGIRRANRQPTNLSSSVLSSDSMHIGILAEAAHAAENKSPFSVFYNPRASPSEFVIPLAKYYKAVYNNQISHGMRFRMMFDTEESGTRRYKGTITAINDIDPVRWKNSQWRNLQVGWDESTAEERRSRVSIWEIEPITTPFFIFPPPFFRSNCLTQHGIPGVDLKSLVVDSNAKEKNSRFLQLSKEQHVFNRYAPVVEEGINEEYNVEVVAEPNLASMALEDTHSSKLKGISTMSFEEIKRRALRRKAPISAKIVPGTSPFSSLPSKSVKLTPDATPGVDSGVSLTFPIDFLSREQGVSISRADADKLLFPAPRLQLSALPPGQVGDEGSTLLIHALQHSLMTRQNIQDLEFELVVLKEKVEGTVDSCEKAKERAERAECLLLTKDIEVRELRERIALLTEEAKDVESFIIMKTRAQLFKQFLEGKSATWDAQGELDFFLENVGDMADLASSVKDDGDDDTTREEGASSADSSFDANMVVEIAEDCDMDA